MRASRTTRMVAAFAAGALATLFAGGMAGAQTTTPPPPETTPPATTPPATNLVPSGQPSFELPRVGDKASQVKLIAGLCAIQMKDMSPMACTCLAEQAMTGLQDPARDYLIASVVAPPVADRMLKDGRVGVPDQKIIFAFLDTTSQACASGTYKPAPAPAAPAPAN